MAVLPTDLDYTNKDFDSVRARLIILIQSVFPEWTDFNTANFGNILMELPAHVLDVLGLYQDNQAAESRWTTARQRKNVLAMVKLIGFEPETAKAASVDITFTVTDTGTGGATLADVVIPAETSVLTAEVTEPIEFQTLADLTILAGVSTGVTSAENSTAQQEITASNNTANQAIVLDEIPFIDGEISVVASDGAYTEVDNFLSSAATDRHFFVQVDQNDRATINFGNGSSGTIPAGTITTDYKTGGGASGSVDSGTLIKVQGAFQDALGNPVTVAATNASKASGGQDRQNVSQIKEAAPQSIQVLERTVSRPDFEIEAEGTEGISRALMATSNQDPGVPENTGLLYLVPEGGGVPSTALKNEIAAIFDEDGTKPATLTFTVLVQDPVYLTVNLQLKVYPSATADLDASSANYLGTLVTAAYTEFFALDNSDGTKNTKIDFGFNYKNETGGAANELALSALQAVAEQLDGVRKLGDKSTDFQVNNEHADLAIGAREFPQLGTVTVISGVTGAAL